MAAPTLQECFFARFGRRTPAAAYFYVIIIITIIIIIIITRSYLHSI
jgi:hypothetical protein